MSLKPPLLKIILVILIYNISIDFVAAFANASFAAAKISRSKSIFTFGHITVVAFAFVTISTNDGSVDITSSSYPTSSAPVTSATTTTDAFVQCECGGETVEKFGRYERYWLEWRFDNYLCTSWCDFTWVRLKCPSRLTPSDRNFSTFV